MVALYEKDLLEGMRGFVFNDGGADKGLEVDQSSVEWLTGLQRESEHIDGFFTGRRDDEMRISFNYSLKFSPSDPDF